MHNEFSIPHQVFESSKFKGLRISSKLLYCYFAKLRNRYADKEGWFWRDEQTISDDTRMHRNTIEKAKKELKKAEFIEVKRGHYQSTGHRGADHIRLNGYLR